MSSRSGIPNEVGGECILLNELKIQARSASELIPASSPILPRSMYRFLLNLRLPFPEY